MFAVHAGRHMPERFFRSNRSGYPHPVYSELVNSGIRVAVGDCSVTKRRRWCPPYQTGKTVHMHANTLQTQRGRTHGAGCVRPWFHTAEPLGERRYENWILTYLNCQITVYLLLFPGKKGYRKDDYTVDCPHLIKKRLCKRCVCVCVY